MADETEAPRSGMVRITKCEVCELMHEDIKLKQCVYCELCEAWICDECRSKWTTRGIAALKKRFGRFFRDT